MDSTTAQIFCARLNVNIVERAAIFNIALVRLPFPILFPSIYYKIRMRIFEIADKNGRELRAAGRVCITRAILISYLRIQYHFSAASRQTAELIGEKMFLLSTH